MKYINLNNQIQMPMLGFGVFQIPAEQTEQAVLDALATGYRHIDTAQAYFNEAEVGQAIAKSGIAREELFITTKVWVSNIGEAKASIMRSLARMQLDYLDLVLIHQPIGDVFAGWRDLEVLQKEGKIRAIGVSNFTPERLVDLGINHQVMPQVNQIEVNPFYQRQAQVSALQQENVVVQAWAPFCEGKNDIFNNEVLKNIAQKYQKTVAQVISRWLIERNIVVLAKTIQAERMAENLAIFDFALNEQDHQAIAQLDLGKSLIFSHDSVESVRFLT